MNNKDHSYERLHLVGLSTHWNMMHGTYNVKQLLLQNELFFIKIYYTFRPKRLLSGKLLQKYTASSDDNLFRRNM